MMSVSWRSLHWGSARHNPLTEIINLLRGRGDNTGRRWRWGRKTQDGDETEEEAAAWRGEDTTAENQIRAERRRNVCARTRTCLFTRVRSGCTDVGACVRDGEEYEGRGKWHYSLPWLLMQFPSLPFSPSFSCLIRNETPREAGLSTRVTSHPSGRSWPARRCHSRPSYPPRRR